ncbi:fibromodulin [Pelobates cultripes]|uniref:Fibromodulin n=1 Tax=Pelobates cultripes TaxID=61616 RepID=A0AAD1VLZ0_PELCU|nr:fibromodulin [Pelobates cultripes]
MKPLAILLVVLLCDVSWTQYEDSYDDSHWWLSYIRSMQYSDVGAPYSYGGAPSYDYDPGPPAPSVSDCPQECECPPTFPTALYCDGRNLKYLPYVPSRVKYAYFQNNQITAVPDGAFDNATGLVWLALHGNQLLSDKVGRKVFSKLRGLERLYMQNNNLTRIPSGLPRSLRELYLSSNQISKMPANALEGLENLTALDLHRNQINEVGSALRGLKSLVHLDISNNQLRKLPDTLPGSLEQMYLEYNYVSSVPSEYFKAYPKLQYVRISHNRLTNEGFPETTFNTTSLVELDLSYNQLHRIPPVNTNLQHLYLQGNQIEEFSVKSFCTFVDITNFSRLQVLRLDGNEIQRNAIPPDTPLCLRNTDIIHV